MITDQINLRVLMMIISFLLANALFVSGFLSGTLLLKLAASGWWAAGIICLFVGEYTSPAVVAAATVLFTFIPGVILDRRHRKNERV